MSRVNRGALGWAMRWTIALAVVASGGSEVEAPSQVHTGEPSGSPVGDPLQTVTRDGAMVPVPAGAFPMGSELGNTDARPAHPVHLRPYRIDRWEATNAPYAAFLNDGQGEHWHPRQAIRKEGGRFAPASGMEDHPVVYVTWADAAAYCRWAGKRLCTEAEWEKAARGGDGRAYPWGNRFEGARLNGDDDGRLDGSADGYPRTASIGRYPDGASPCGALDMAGNVAEWVQDWYSEGYYREGPAQDPPGPASGTHRVVRGGSWFDLPLYTRTYNRAGVAPGRASPTIGFRCCKDETP